MGSDPRKGAVVFFDWAGSRNIPAIDHVGIVEAVKGGGRTIVTLEGNTANQLKRRERSLGHVAGFGYPAYPAVKALAKPKPKPELNWTEVMVKKLPELRPGVKGWDVKTAYGLLYSRGFPVAAGADETMFVGPLGEALLAFKKSAGLPATEKIDEDTWAALLRVA
ncbi:CHAP domain-containing protein [Nonomuraea soli]|uniref:Murein L,D-transpeptidase YcbB/YkuD n=1 Tax=Nonomuraea soli TaxID=1032476 RepID=A0A7W0HUT2_9ACTN|nr:CHAP domain-containing protein [Nonomuraea soli]MBA2896425.1 murein L,D-transpeptidase YcbB/YkuD [Nonomuraea soli]